MGSNEAAVGIFVVLVIFGFPVVAFIIHRVLKHQERIEMIRRGMPPMAEMPGPAWNAKSAAPPPPPYNAAAQQYGFAVYASAQNQLRKGITLAMVGMALLIGLSFIHLGMPGPWLLGGLIPLFVGLAQVIIAILSGARLGPIDQTYVGGPPPSQMGRPQQEQQAGAGAAAPGPYTYRPGSTVELEPPAPPPDPRR